MFLENGSIAPRPLRLGLEGSQEEDCREPCSKPRADCRGRRMADLNLLSPDRNESTLPQRKRFFPKSHFQCVHSEQRPLWLPIQPIAATHSANRLLRPCHSRWAGPEGKIRRNASPSPVILDAQLAGKGARSRSSCRRRLNARFSSSVEKFHGGILRVERSLDRPAVTESREGAEPSRKRRISLSTKSPFARA